MNVLKSQVRPDGTSELVEKLGIHDMASIGLDNLNPELEKRMQELIDPSLAQTEAKFKLEVFFRSGARRNVPVRGIISAWTNGGFLNGGGDMIVYFCPHKREDGKTCLNPIDVQFAAGKQNVCTVCRRITEERDLCGQVEAMVEMPQWATLITRFFSVLECNADIRVNIERQSITKAIELEKERNRGGEIYARMYAEREWITYPLASLIRDTGNGATLERRIRAFLEA